MQTIDLTKEIGCKVMVFPDGEHHLTVEKLNRKEDVEIRCRITCAADLFLLMQLSDILKRQCIEVSLIRIYYLMGMRCDRLFDIHRPFTLRIVADVVNSFNARLVSVYEAHSPRVAREIKNCILKDLTHEMAIDFIKEGYSIAIPDKGAAERYDTLNPCVFCTKKRDEATGELRGFSVEQTGRVDGKDLIVVDDLCDGGGTFVGLAPGLRELGPKSLSLLVTHAVQLEGIKRVSAVYDSVYITDTYTDWTKHELPKNVTVYTATE